MTSSLCLSPRDKTFSWKTCNLQIHPVTKESSVLLQASPSKITQTVSLREPGLKRRKRKERKRRQKERRASILASSKKHESEGQHDSCVLVCVCPEKPSNEKKERKKTRTVNHSECFLVSASSQVSSPATKIPRSRKRRIQKRILASLAAVKTADAAHRTGNCSQGSPATLSSVGSILRLASSNSPPSPPVSRSRSPPRTPRSSRTQDPRSRVGSPSPVRDQSQTASPRQSRIDTPTRRSRVQAQRVRRVQYPCRNSGCHESFRMCRQRNSHENSSCSRRSQHQVQ